MVSPTGAVVPRALGRDTARNRALHLHGKGLFLVPAALYLAALTFFPMYQLVRMSFSHVTPEVLYKPWPFVGLSEFQQAIKSPDFSQALLNTLIYVGVVLFTGLVGGFIAALILWRSTPLTSIAFGVVVFVWAMPPLVNASVWRFLLDQRGLVDSILALFHLPGVLWLAEGRLPLVAVALVNAWASVPFATIVYRAALMDIPQELLEAAAVDGAVPRQIVLRVIVPLLRPVIVVLSVVTIVYAFRSFDFIYIMTSGGPGTISTTLPYLAYREAFQVYQYSVGAATAVIAVLIVLVMAVVYMRQVRAEQR
ncbi:MAG: sugar ABC transporter permease [Chloroflexi bacterium]|nr:sugar ABC transporter permease [Chloroflexota bacterium]